MAVDKYGELERDADLALEKCRENEYGSFRNK